MTRNTEHLTPDTDGEWELGPLMLHGGVECKDVLIKGVDRFAGGYVCNAMAKHAAQIVADHNSKALLVEAASNALKSFRYMRDVDPQHWDFHVTPEVCTAWDTLRAALKAAGVEK